MTPEEIAEAQKIIDTPATAENIDTLKIVAEFPKKTDEQAK